MADLDMDVPRQEPATGTRGGCADLAETWFSSSRRTIHLRTGAHTQGGLMVPARFVPRAPGDHEAALAVAQVTRPSFVFSRAWASPPWPSVSRRRLAIAKW